MNSPILRSALSVALLLVALTADVSYGQSPAAGRRRPAAPLEPIVYTLRFPAPQTHYVEVEAAVPTGGAPSIELMMAVWTPGSYLVREYERHVEALAARGRDGTALAVEKTQKNRWRIETAGASPVTVTYRVYGREMTVRNNWIEGGFAMLNGAPTFLTLVGGTSRPHDVSLVLPAAWQKTVTALPTAPGGAAHHYLAPDYDTLVDSPIIAGNPSVHEFEVDGKRHYLVNAGDDSLWDAERSVKDLMTIVREWRRMWGFLPYPSYYFLNVISESGSGLEHKNCALLMASRWQTRTRKAYLAWGALASHEYLHAWNVKRLRPVELGPFDYEKENYTRTLWEAEGFTEYYGNLAVVRSGLATREEYFALLSEEIAELHAAPGRLITPLQRASFDAWIKEYRPDENTVNTTISYYTKGSQAAFLLDAKIRRATAGRRSLDEAMRLAYERYSGPHGFTPADFRRTVEEVAGVSLEDWFASAIDGTEELDYREALAWFGLRFASPRPRAAEGVNKAWLGAKTRTDAGRLIISELRRGTPAYDSGLSVDDELIAIDDYRVRPEQMDERLKQYAPGDRVTLTVSRRERLERYQVTLRPEPGNPWVLEVDPGATPEQVDHLAKWLTGPEGPVTPGRTGL